MMNFCCRRFTRCSVFLLGCILASSAHGQGAKHFAAKPSAADADSDREKERAAWFYRGRIVPGKNSAELRRRAYRSKIEMRMRRAEVAAAAKPAARAAASLSGSWSALGPGPLASDARGRGG